MFFIHLFIQPFNKYFLNMHYWLHSGVNRLETIILTFSGRQLLNRKGRTNRLSFWGSSVRCVMMPWAEHSCGTWQGSRREVRLGHGHTGWTGTCRPLKHHPQTGGWSLSGGSASTWRSQHFLDLRPHWLALPWGPRPPTCLWMWVGNIRSSFSLTSNWNVSFPLVINVGKSSKVCSSYSWLVTSKNQLFSCCNGCPTSCPVHLYSWITPIIWPLQNLVTKLIHMYYHNSVCFKYFDIFKTVVFFVIIYILH